jgi:hypothetical protein
VVQASLRILDFDLARFGGNVAVMQPSAMLRARDAGQPSRALLTGESGTAGTLVDRSTNALGASRGRNVQLTIDSSQKLDDVIRVVGALYNVQLGIVGTAASKAVVASSRGSSRSAPSRGSASRGSGRRPNRGSASTAEVRAWAQTNGYQVNSRGRIPMTVKNAFEAKGS